MNLRFTHLLSVVLCLFLGPVTGSMAEPNNSQSPKELIESLKSGGYIIYMRHGITTRKDKSRNKRMVDISVCETQRNLTAEGISQVTKIGHIIASQKIPIGQVKSSPYCRTKDTARAVFGDFEVDDLLAFSIGKEEEESEKLGKYLLDSMLATDDDKKNAVYVGHTANLKDGLGVWPKPEGVAVVFKKEGAEIIFKGMIKPNDWLEL